MGPARIFVAAVMATLLATGCSPGEGTGPEEEGNPFLVDYRDPGKEDTAYVNLDGIEVEVDFEADVEATSWRIFDAPTELGQYALTYLRNRRQFYIESLAEIATSDQRVEWLVEGEWITAEAARDVPAEQLRRFRIRGMNAVMLYPIADNASVGQVFEAEVPIRPYDVMSEAGDVCADPDNHMTLSQSIYWYQWNPDRANCEVDTQQAQITVARLFRTQETVYPEYDRLVEDGQVTAVVLFGLIGDDMSDNDSGFYAMNTFARNLLGAGFEEVEDPPVGRRFRKVVNEIELLYDLYSPRDFSGLSDHGNYGNFERAVTEHEIIAYDGHSMLGASDFWGRPDYPSFYQIFLYGGCLGYQYYVQPIVEGKGGWDNVDILSSVIEVSANANRYAAPFLARLEEAILNGYTVSWPDMLRTIRSNVGDSSFGVSGISGNCFTPSGSRCGGGGEATRYESTAPVEVPDNDPVGVTSVIEVTDQLTAGTVMVEIDMTHTYVGDLRIVLEHGGVEAIIWDRTGGGDDNIQQTFPAASFAGAEVGGTWTLTVSDHAGQDIGTLNRWALVISE